MDCILKLPMTEPKTSTTRGRKAAPFALKASEYLRRFREATDSSQAT
jgi:hypothetical protein